MREISKQTGDLIRKYSGHTTTISCLRLNNKQLFSCSFDRTIKQWDTNVSDGITNYITYFETGELLMTYKGHGGAVTSVDFSGDRTQIFTSSTDGFVFQWDTKVT